MMARSNLKSYKYQFMSMFLLPHYHKSHLCTGATRLPLSPYSVARRPRTAARGETRRPSYINTQFMSINGISLVSSDELILLQVLICTQNRMQVIYH